MPITVPGVPGSQVSAEVGGPRLDPRVSLEDVGGGLVNAAEAITGYFKIEQNKADQVARTAAERRLSDSENLLLFDPKTGAFNKKGKDAFGLPEEILPQYDEHVKEVAATLPKRLQPAFTAQAAARRNDIAQQLNRHVAGEANAYDQAETNALIQSSQQAATNNWGDTKRIGLELARQHDAIAAYGRRTGAPDAVIADQIAAAHSKTHLDVIDHWLADDNPKRARQYYGLVQDTLTSEARTAAANAIRVAEKRKEQEGKEAQMLARQALTEEMQDINSAAVLGVPVTAIPSRAEFVTAFGPVKGDAHFKTAVQLQGLAGTIAELHTMTNQDLALEKGAIGAAKPTQVEGAQDQAFVYSTIKQAANSIIAQRQQDPAGYLLENSPAVQAAAKGMQAPGGPQRFLSAVEAAKGDLGIDSPNVLPKAMAQNIVSRLGAVQAPEKMVKAIHDEQAVWGNDWPRVYRQLAPNLPDTALVIGSGDRLRGDIPQRAENTLAAMAQLPAADVAKRIPASTTSLDIDKKVADALTDLSASIPAEGSRSYTAFANATRLLAIGYMGQGMNMGDAVEQASKDLVTERDHFTDFRGVPYRVPSRIDPRAIDLGASALLLKYETPSNVVPLFGLQPSEVEQGRVTAMVRNKGYWVTAPDGSGLMLYANGQRVPIDSSGKTLRYTWQQLMEAAAERQKELPAGNWQTRELDEGAR